MNPHNSLFFLSPPWLVWRAGSVYPSPCFGDVEAAVSGQEGVNLHVPEHPLDSRTPGRVPERQAASVPSSGPQMLLSVPPDKGHASQVFHMRWGTGLTSKLRSPRDRGTRRDIPSRTKALNSVRSPLRITQKNTKDRGEGYVIECTLSQNGKTVQTSAPLLCLV